MKLVASLFAIALLTACSSAPTEVAQEEPPPPPEPITGRQAFQSTFVTARGWAADAEPVRIRNFNLLEPASVDGKAGAWEVTYASASMGAVRAFTWSSVEAQGLNKGVYGGQTASWAPGGRDPQFQSSLLGVDTPELLETAKEHATEYLESEGEKPPVTFLLETTSRFPNPVWRVMWGDSVGTAQFSVFLDATTGDYLGL